MNGNEFTYTNLDQATHELKRYLYAHGAGGAVLTLCNELQSAAAAYRDLVTMVRDHTPRCSPLFAVIDRYDAQLERFRLSLADRPAHTIPPTRLDQAIVMLQNEDAAGALRLLKQIQHYANN